MEICGEYDVSALESDIGGIKWLLRESRDDCGCHAVCCDEAWDVTNIRIAVPGSECTGCAVVHDRACVHLVHSNG